MFEFGGDFAGLRKAVLGVAGFLDQRVELTTFATKAGVARRGLPLPGLCRQPPTFDPE
jgi:hypothetical protein